MTPPLLLFSLGELAEALVTPKTDLPLVFA